VRGQQPELKRGGPGTLEGHEFRFTNDDTLRPEDKDIYNERGLRKLVLASRGQASPPST